METATEEEANIFENEAAKLADEVGDSLSAFLEVLNREMIKIKFKEYQSNYININWQFSNTSSLVSLRSATAETLNINKKEINDEENRFRFFSFPKNKNDIKNIFWLIILWREDIFKKHSAILKDQQHKLFN